MVGRNIGDHRHIGLAGHAVQLKRGQFQHAQILRGHFRDLAQQRMPDITAQMNRFSGSFQQLGNHGTGSRFSVRPGDGNRAAGTQLEEHFHFTGDLHALGCSRLQMGVQRQQSGGSEQKVKVCKTFQIRLSQLQRCPQFPQVGRQFPHLSFCTPVTDSHPAIFAAKQFDQGQIAHACTDHGNFFRAKFIDIFRKFHDSVTSHNQ